MQFFNDGTEPIEITAWNLGANVLSSSQLPIQIPAGDTVTIPLTFAPTQQGSVDENITFIKVDWDTYKNHPVTRSRNVPRRSTLLVLRGDEELGRIIAGTSPSDIEALLAKGL